MRRTTLPQRLTGASWNTSGLGSFSGLTATAERADGQDLLELFRNCAHRFTLQEAVERGELVPIRCVRVRNKH